MVRLTKCDCSERFETRINSYSLFQEINDFFENAVKQDVFEDIPVSKPLRIYGDDGKNVTEWYPSKWYKCKICHQLWAFEYPDFPAQGYVYKLDEFGNNDDVRVR